MDGECFLKQLSWRAEKEVYGLLEGLPEVHRHWHQLMGKPRTGSSFPGTLSSPRAPLLLRTKDLLRRGEKRGQCKDRVASTTSELSPRVCPTCGRTFLCPDCPHRPSRAGHIEPNHQASRDVRGPHRSQWPKKQKPIPPILPGTDGDWNPRNGAKGKRLNLTLHCHHPHDSALRWVVVWAILKMVTVGSKLQDIVHKPLLLKRRIWTLVRQITRSTLSLSQTGTHQKYGCGYGLVCRSDVDTVFFPGLLYAVSLILHPHLYFWKVY